MKLFKFNDMPARYRKSENPHAQMCSWLVDVIGSSIIERSRDLKAFSTELKNITFQMGEVEIGINGNETLISIGLIPDDAVFVRFLVVFKVINQGDDMLWNGVYNIAVFETKIIEKGKVE